MKLESLKLTNFRGFRELEISFDPSFTVLLGANMAGKTAVLDAAALALRLPLGGETPPREIDDDDVHQVVVVSGRVPVLYRQFPAAIEALATHLRFADGRGSWHLHRATPHEPTRLSGDRYPFLNTPTSDTLPVIALYGVQRHWERSAPPDDPRGIGPRYNGYRDAFDVRSAQSAIAGWIRKQTIVQLQNGEQPQLAAVEAAVKQCIGEVKRFWYDVQYDELRLERTSDEIQPFATLSEGVRNMVMMVADIAWRCAVLNPQHVIEAHLKTDGVVLIDELDLHLHPAWQRRVVGDLRRTFPKIQFIVTTHSPQIVASVSRSQIRLLDENRLVTEEPYVEGRNTNEILEDVFGVPARPLEVQEEIDALYRSIEDEDFAAAHTQLAALEQRFGPDDKDIIRAKWILDAEQPRAGAEPSPRP